MGRPRTLPDPKPMPCTICGKIFMPHRGSKNPKYCSNACRFVVLGGRNGRLPPPDPRPCAECGIEFTPPKPKKFKQIYCTVLCQRRAQVKKNLPATRTEAALKKRGDVQRGRGEGKAYTKLLGRHEHRVVMEQKLGRELGSDEIVHHIDGDIKNNHPDNLELTNRADHFRHHLDEHQRKEREARRRTDE